MQLFASGGTKYTWSPSESLDDFRSFSPIATPVESTLYRVIGQDANGCSDSTSVEVLVQNTVFIPNLFTPNADGNNDVFRVYGSGVAELSIKIFDLHGTQIFASQDINTIMNMGWDGSFGGKTVPSETYVWIIDGRFANGSKVLFQNETRGFIKLLR